MLRKKVITKIYHDKLIKHIYAQCIILAILVGMLIFMEISDDIGTKVIYLLLVSVLSFLFLGMRRFFSLFDKYERESALYQDSFEVLKNVSLYIVDLDFNYMYMNKSNIEFLDKYYKIHPKIGENISKYLTPSHVQAFKQEVDAAISSGFKVSEEILKIDGQDLYLYTTYSPVKNGCGEIYAICCVTTNMTEYMKEKDKLTELAYQDPLTSIFNRRKAFDYYQTIKKENQKIWVLLFDLNNFKNLNDTHGHLAGDQLLIDFSNLLKSTFPLSAVITRWGGDEFLVLTPNMPLDDLREIESSIQKKSNNLDKLGISSAVGEIFAEDTSDKDLAYYIEAVDAKMYEQKKSQKQNTREYPRLEEDASLDIAEHVSLE